jgi:hypothetical protein
MGENLKGCLGRVLSFKLGSFVIFKEVHGANEYPMPKVENSAQVSSGYLKFVLTNPCPNALKMQLLCILLNQKSNHKIIFLCNSGLVRNLRMG